MKRAYKIFLLTILGAIIYNLGFLLILPDYWSDFSEEFHFYGFLGGILMVFLGTKVDESKILTNIVLIGLIILSVNHHEIAIGLLSFVMCLGTYNYFDDYHFLIKE